MGQVYYHTKYCKKDGRDHPKYMLIMALDHHEILYRVLTTSSTGRVETPACCHDDPYPSFYVGVIGPPLTKRSWIDLQQTMDADRQDFENAVSASTINFVLDIDTKLLLDIIDCTANAQDTSRRQSSRLADQAAELRKHS